MRGGHGNGISERFEFFVARLQLERPVLQLQIQFPNFFRAALILGELHLKMIASMPQILLDLAPNGYEPRRNHRPSHEREKIRKVFNGNFERVERVAKIIVVASCGAG